MHVNKFVPNFIAIFLLLTMICLYGWNFWNGDRDAYELYYYNFSSILNWKKELGYAYINLLANKIGIPYQEFQIIIAIITLLLLYRFFKNSAYSPAFSLLIYFIVFFPLDYVLMRNYLAFVIVLQGLLILYRGEKFCNLKYALIVILSASIHQSAILFLVFIFTNSEKPFSTIKYFLLCALYAICYLLFTIQTDFYFFVDAQQHLDNYSYSFKSAMMNSLIHLSSSFCIWILIILEKRGLYSLKADSLRNAEIIFSFNLNLFSLFFIPLYFQSEIFVRFMRYVLFFNIFYFINSIVLRKKCFPFALLCFFVFSGYLIFYFLYPVMELTVFPLFNDNILLGG